jgi:hypothetical protein
VIPPLNPTQQCRKQALVNLSARTAQGVLPTARRVNVPNKPAPDAKDLAQQFRQFNRGIKTLGADGG